MIYRYRVRAASVSREQGKDIYYLDVPMEMASAQLLKDLEMFGSNYVYEEACNEGYMELYGDGSFMCYDWIGHHDCVFDGKVE